MVNMQLETEPYTAGAQSVDCLLIPNLFSSVFSLLVQGESATHKNKWHISANLYLNNSSIHKSMANRIWP